MWYQRDFEKYITSGTVLPIKVLKGPRQVGKTSFLERLGTHKIVYLDDATVRSQAQENPKFFLENLKGKIALDEAALAPALFPELKRRVDIMRRSRLEEREVDYWLTGSNQTLLRKNVRESLAGRASYFDFNTLSINELGKDWELGAFLLRGGWPELYVNEELDPVRYLNDLVATFIEKDIVSAAGIEKKASFTKLLQLLAGRTGQLFNASDLAASVGVDATTISSWVSILEDNGVVRLLRPYWSNVNKRLTKSPKIYFEDVGLATRLQGWSELQPILASPAAGHLIETIALGEIVRFFVNRGQDPQVSFLRSKEKTEVDFLVHLPNQRVVAAEVKTTPQDLSGEQVKLIESSCLNVVARWILSPTSGTDFPHARLVPFEKICEELAALDT